MYIFKAVECLRFRQPNLFLNKICLLLTHTPNLCHSSRFTECNKVRSVKPDDGSSFPLKYEPKKVEEGWYEYWEENNFFSYDPCQELSQGQISKQPFCMVLPPPNVTGNLHIGHTLTVTIQDCICRWRRMKGDKVCWIPGYDHGGIATQTVVEKKLFQERKLTRHDFGKEGFLKEVHSFKTVTQRNIERQLKTLGSSFDFGKSSCTIDENASKAVEKMFIQLFDEDFIYRKEKLVNWSSHIQSVISDMEVDHQEITGKKSLPGLNEAVDLGLLDYFYYPVTGSGILKTIQNCRI